MPPGRYLFAGIVVGAHDVWTLQRLCFVWYAFLYLFLTDLSHKLTLISFNIKMSTFCLITSSRIKPTWLNPTSAEIVFTFWCTIFSSVRGCCASRGVEERFSLERGEAPLSLRKPPDINICPSQLSHEEKWGGTVVFAWFLFFWKWGW